MSHEDYRRANNPNDTGDRYTNPDGTPRIRGQELPEEERQELIDAGYEDEVRRAEQDTALHRDFPWTADESTTTVAEDGRDDEDNERYPIDK